MTAFDVFCLILNGTGAVTAIAFMVYQGLELFLGDDDDGDEE